MLVDPRLPGTVSVGSFFSLGSAPEPPKTAVTIA
jgi:hypothetical protein